MSGDLILGWLLGVISSLVTSIVMFWLEGLREERREKARQRLEDIRTASSWSHDGKRVSLRGFDLSGANLAGRDLSGADLEGANLEGAGLVATNFSNANLRGANLRKAKIRRTKFCHAALHHADFTLAEIYHADFSEARLRMVDFSKAKLLEECIWTSAAIEETTIFPGTMRPDTEALQHADRAPDTSPSKTPVKDQQK